MRKMFLATLAIVAVLGLGGCQSNNASDVLDEAQTREEEDYSTSINDMTDTPTLTETSTPTPAVTNADIFEYEIVDNAIVITGLKEEQEHIVIPSEIEGIAVTTIGEEAFVCGEFISVDIPNSVTRIESDAFDSCKNLVSIEIPNSVTYIGGGVFSWCESLESIKIPKSVKEIRGDQFFCCDNLKAVTVEDNSYAKNWAMEKYYKVNYYSSSREVGSYSEQDVSNSTIETLSERVGGKLYVGDEFTLGTYEQDNYIDNGKEPIEWIVYAKDGDGYLCISKYVLDWQPFSTDMEKEIPNAWKESDIREWLNGTFYNEAFSDIDKENLVSMDTRYSGWKDKSDLKIDRLSSNDYVRLINWGEFDNHPGCVKVTEFAKMNVPCYMWYSYVMDDGTREHENCCDRWGMMTFNVDLVEYTLNDSVYFDGWGDVYDAYLSMGIARYRHEEYTSISSISVYNTDYVDNLIGVRPVIKIQLNQ